MKTYIFALFVSFLGFFSFAQNDTEIIIISDDENISAENINITIKKDGKKIKVNPEDIRIISRPETDMNFRFNDMDDFGNIEDMQEMFELNFGDFQLQMSRMFGGLNQMKDLFEHNMPLPEVGSSDLDEFNKKFQDLKSEESNEMELGEGKSTYLFKSDDGRPIIEEKIIIKKETKEEAGNDIFDSAFETNTDAQPLIFLNGEPFSGTMDDIDQNSIRSMKVEKGTNVIKKFGKKGENGVIYIQTKD